MRLNDTPNAIGCIYIFSFREFLVFDKFSQSYLAVTFCSHEIYEFIVTRTSRDRKFPEKKKLSARDVISWYKCFSHPSITDSTQPQNALLRIVVQKQSFPREPNLLYSTGLSTNITEDPPPSTGLLGRPLEGCNLAVPNLK